MVRGGLVAAAEDPAHKARIFEQVPIAEPIKLPAGRGDRFPGTDLTYDRFPGTDLTY